MGSMWSSTRRKFSRAVGGSQHLRTKPAFGFAGRHAAALHAGPRRRALLDDNARARRQICDERRIQDCAITRQWCSTGAARRTPSKSPLDNWLTTAQKNETRLVVKSAPRA